MIRWKRALEDSNRVVIETKGVSIHCSLQESRPHSSGDDGEWIKWVDVEIVDYYADNVEFIPL